MKKALLFAGRVTAGYLVVGVLWALFSENLLSVLFREKEVFEQFYQNRDWFYVFTAAILLFLLIGYYFIAIQSATKRYQDFFNDFPIGFYRRTLDGKILDVNRTFVDIFGYPDEETLLNQNIEILYVEHSDFLRFQEEVRSEGKVRSFNAQFKKYDGTPFWAEVHTNYVEENHQIYLDGGVIDIQSRIDAEHQLFREQRLAESLMESSPIYFTILDKDNKLIRMNKTMQTATGYDWEEIEGQPYVSKFIPANDRERVRNLFKQIFDGDIVNDNTNKIITKSGDSMCVDWYNEVIRDEDGEIEFLYGYGVDVTQKMAADKEIRKLSEAVQQSPDYIMITDSDGTIEYVNPAFVQNTGFSVEESIGKNPRILKSGQTSSEVYKDLWGTIMSGKTWKGELLNKKKNGELYWESATISPTIDQNGHIINYVAIKHDITERKAREVEIRLLNESLLKAYDATIEGWAKALELRDMETEGHSRRVVDMTIHLAQNLGINDEDLMHIRRGALLHDIGKMAIPDHILQKPGPLTKEEWKIMREHPVYAWKWLSTIEHLHFSLDIPYCHHEKWDGTGYPRGLQGEEIPLAARIFSIIDVFDALTSDRPYRKAWSQEKTLEYIREQRGSHFDPQITDVFLRMRR